MNGESSGRKPTASRRSPLGLWVAAVTLVAGLGAAAANHFKPPRVAVVDISRVFDDYSKKKDRESVLKKDMDELQARLGNLQSEYETIRGDIKTLDPESSSYLKMSLRAKEIELEVQRIKQTKLKRLRETQLSFLREIRDEISSEIEDFAVAHDLDMVFESQVSAEVNGGGMGFRWPIVHYARPAYDITAEITERLNDNYKK